MKIWAWMVLFLSLVVFTGCSGMKMGGGSDDRQDVLYTCNCGPQCKCNSMSIKPGKCNCGMDLVWGHLVKVEGDEALLCMCAEGCKCAIDPNDSTKCGCGKELKRVNLKGSGLYFCNCGGSCSCNIVSDQAGQCRCGMNLKKVD
ncbi:MAG: hypothetical protein KKB30_12290 [Proteobacteria bacterium]|nr:hypothetical protein [Pseudomonadota bacterium]MBU1715252.1 hypothetical protein [Pseudomonadota bacterium]